MVCWPSAQVSPMGAEGAAKVILGIGDHRRNAASHRLNRWRAIYPVINGRVKAGVSAVMTG